jgi:hypothetical protein
MALPITASPIIAQSITASAKPLKNTLSNAIQHSINGASTKEIKITILFNGKESVTVFKVRNDGNSITVYNKCISITYSLDNGLYTFGSSLKKNNEEKRCFEPPLDVKKHNNANVTKYTMMDALQVLATKIKLAMTDIVDVLKGKIVGSKGPINIEDAATIKSMSISKYRILRGQDTIYEKYGYKSHNLETLKEYINELSWDDLLELFGGLDELFGKIRQSPKVNELKQKLASVNGSKPLTEVLSTISFEDEYNLRPAGINKTVTLSEVIYQKITDLVFTDKKINPLILTFNENSDEWRKMRDVVRIVNVEEVASVKGGRNPFKRITRRNRRTTRKNK